MTMKFPLNLLRFALLSSAGVVVVTYLYLYPHAPYAKVDSITVTQQIVTKVDSITINQQIDADGSVKILMYTPNQLVGNQRARTQDHVIAMNAGTGVGAGCQMQCKWTMDRNEMANADAVVFYFFTVGYRRKDLPMKGRRPDQIWAMHTREAPPFSWCDMGKLNGVFNWTINYRKDSDIWGPFRSKLAKGVESESQQAPILIANSTLDQWIAQKEELVTQVVSRCKSQSKREVLVEMLKKAGLPIHVYGGCGKKLCGRLDKCTEVWENQIGRKYRFYLAFENSICEDYITEKLWRSLELGMVPVVYGGGNYLEEAPPNSFIDVRMFTSAKELTEYLIKLDKEPEEYKKFFEWRKHFTTVRGEGEWCKLCVALHERKFRIINRNKVYEDLEAWYFKKDPYSHEKTACQENPPFFKHT